VERVGLSQGAGAPAIEDGPVPASDAQALAAPISEDVRPAAPEPDIAGDDASCDPHPEAPGFVLDVASPGPSDVSTEVTSEAPTSSAAIELPEHMPVPVPLPPLWASDDDICDEQGGRPVEVLVPPDQPEGDNALLRVLEEDEPDHPAAFSMGVPAFRNSMSCAPTEPPPMVALDLANPGGREASPEATSDAPAPSTVIEPERIPVAVHLPLWASDYKNRDEQGDRGWQVGVPPESGDGLLPLVREDEREDLPPALMDLPAASDTLSDAHTDLPPVPAIERKNSGDDAANSEGSSDVVDGASEPAAILALPERMPVPVPLPPLWASDDGVDEGTGEQETAAHANQPCIDGALVPGDLPVSEGAVTPQPFTDADLTFACEATP
jgi:hypothetical protein